MERPTGIELAKFTRTTTALAITCPANQPGIREHVDCFVDQGVLCCVKVPKDVTQWILVSLAECVRTKVRYRESTTYLP
jgi:hypothetical protein